MKLVNSDSSWRQVYGHWNHLWTGFKTFESHFERGKVDVENYVRIARSSQRICLYEYKVTIVLVKFTDMLASREMWGGGWRAMRREFLNCLPRPRTVVLWGTLKFSVLHKYFSLPRRAAHCCVAPLPEEYLGDTLRKFDRK